MARRGRPPVRREKEERERFAAQQLLAWIAADGEIERFLFDGQDDIRGFDAVKQTWLHLYPDDWNAEFALDEVAKYDARKSFRKRGADLSDALTNVAEDAARHRVEAVHQDVLRESLSAPIDRARYRSSHSPPGFRALLYLAQDLESAHFERHGFLEPPRDGPLPWRVIYSVRPSVDAVLQALLADYLNGAHRFVFRCALAAEPECRARSLSFCDDPRRIYCGVTCLNRAAGRARRRALSLDRPKNSTI